MPKFTGPEYEPSNDEARLTKQLDRIVAVMSDGGWRTHQEIAFAAKAPATSVSSQLRNLRMKENGGWTVERRARGDRKAGMFEYRLVQTIINKEHLLEQVKRRREILEEMEARYLKAKKELQDAEDALAVYEGGPRQPSLL